MKGLIKNQMYGAWGSAVVLFAFAIAAGLYLVCTGNPSFMTIFVLAAATIFAINAVASLRKEASSKWCNYVLTTPTTRKVIVKSRYVHHAIWLTIGLMVSALFVAFTVAIHGNRFFHYTFRDPLTLFSMSMGTGVLMGALFYPAVYLLGTDKSEIMMILSLLVSIGLTLGITWLLNAAYSFKALSDTEYYISIGAYWVIVIAAFIASYYLTVFVYRKKEY